MKKLLILTAVLATVIASCDKVKNTVPASPMSGTLDWSLYPDGDSAHYVAQGLWPTFTANTNTQRNVLIEDFTGHRCPNSPSPTSLMQQLIATNPTRIYGIGIHTGPSGLTAFQETSAAFPTILYCDAGLEMGKHFGQDIPNSTFVGNSAFCVNRTLANGQFTSNAGSAITNKTNTCLASTLKINIQAVTNYFPSTRGLFLHTEVDKIDASVTLDLALVVCLVEDSLIARQTVPSNPTWDPDGTPGDPDLSHSDGINETYTHRNILRGCIDGNAFGRDLTAAYLGTNGKYYINYTYQLPAQYDAANMHLVIYVYDKITQEIYQVIEKHLL
ncbi:Omp28-related outer membrane protein [Fluviicola taffensis]|uniref:Omp28-related outer membrane protein n=1 Tax=Fluviicola taffensis TaxID=191579 RepID=UPI003137A779